MSTLHFGKKLVRLFGTLEPEPECCYIDRIPSEILSKIFKHLNSAKDFVSCSKTCKKWRQVIRIPLLQKDMLCKLILIT